MTTKEKVEELESTADRHRKMFDAINNIFTASTELDKSALARFRLIEKRFVQLSLASIGLGLILVFHLITSYA